MGMFSFIEKSLGLRTGATQAAREAKEAGEDYLGQQQDFQSQLLDIYKPSMNIDSGALSRLAGSEQDYYNEAMSLPSYDFNVKAGEDAIARNRQATGGFRSGTTQQNLAENSQGVLQSIVDRMINKDRYLADFGGMSRNAYSNAGAGILNQIGGTMGQNAQIGINQAANKKNTITGIANLATNIGSKFI